MAQDFHSAFGVGPDDKHIATVDADGVTLAAIQGLNEKLESSPQKTECGLQSLNAELKRRAAENAELKQRLEELERLVKSRFGLPPKFHNSQCKRSTLRTRNQSDNEDAAYSQRFSHSSPHRLSLSVAPAAKRRPVAYPAHAKIQ